MTLESRGSTADIDVAGLLRCLPVGVLIWRLERPDDDGSLRLIAANQAATDSFGVDLTPLIGRPVLEAFPGLPDERIAIYAGVARSGVARDLGEVVYADDRIGTRTFWIRAFPITENTMGILIDDRTEHARRANELRRLHRFLNSIVELVPAMIFVKDAEELRFELFNRAGEELLGVSRDALLDKTDHDLFPADQAVFFQNKDREVLRGGKVVDIAEEPIDTAAGRRWLYTRKVPIMDEQGEPRHLLGISVDITERREAQHALVRANDELDARVRERTAELEEANAELRRQIEERLKTEQDLQQVEHQLRHSQKMDAVGRLAGGVSHDFNNMLSVVLSQAEMILSDLSNDDPLRRDVEEIRQAGLRASELTRQLLAFSRQQVMHPRVTDLNHVISGLERMLRRLVGADIEITVLTCPSPWRIFGDPGQLEQVLVNLVVNARDAMPRGGKLTIQTRNVELDQEYAKDHIGVTPGAYAMLAVSDTGHGMDRETQLRIFEPFFTTKDKGKGTGLGLATVFGIVKQSSGHLWVYSEPGCGTTFRVYLPRTESQPSDRHNSTPVPRSVRGNETILLVEDEPTVRSVARSILRRNGYTVLEAANPGDALLIIEQHAARIHLLLTDVVLPRMSGPELAKRLTTARPEMRVLFMSGYTDEAMQQHGVLDSGFAFLQKPITPEALLRRVREVLSAPAHPHASS